MKETCSFAKEMGKRVAQRRKELGLTQEKAAERCGLSQQFFASIETGGKNVRGESLLKLAMGLDISADYLLTGRQPEGEANPQSPLDLQLEGIDFALFGEVRDMTDAQKRDVLKFAKFLKEKGD